MNTFSLVCDPLRDRAIEAYQFTSKNDMFAYTEYMIMCSEVLRSVDIDDSPELIITERAVDLRDAVVHIRPTFENIRVYLKLVSDPFGSFAWDLIETLAKPYARTSVPVFNWLWQEGILPQVYDLLRLSWPTTRLTAEQVSYMASHLKDAMYCHTWPNSYLESAEECALCTEICITEKFRMHCGHWCCNACQMRWLREANTCPFCRSRIFWDLD